jgi:hypothetical protein
MTEPTYRMWHNARIDEYNRSLKAVLRIEDELDTVKLRQKQERDLFTEQQKDIRNDLKEAGLSLKAFNHLVAQEMAKRKLRKNREKLDDHVQHELDIIEEQLASMRGTPLGDAAYEAAVTDVAKSHGFSNGAELLNSLKPLEEGQVAN